MYYPQLPTQSYKDDIPQVSFDVKFGKSHKYVDFDYDAYEQLIFDQGGTSEDYQQAKLLIQAPTSVSQLRHLIGSSKKGWYDSSDGTINAQPYSRNTDTVLVHETEHYLDHRHGELTNFVAPYIGIKALKYSTYAMLADIAAYNIPSEASKSVSEIYAPYAPYLALGSLVAAACLYYGDKSERRARKAQSRHVDTHILRMQPK